MKVRYTERKAPCMLDKVLYQHVSGSLFSHKTHLEGTLKLHNPNLFTHIFMPKPFMYLYVLVNSLVWHLSLQLLSHPLLLWNSSPSRASFLPITGAEHIPYSLQDSALIVPSGQNTKPPLGELLLFLQRSGSILSGK